MHLLVMVIMYILYHRNGRRIWVLCGTYYLILQRLLLHFKLRQCFESQQIEDFWLSYICVSSDLTSHVERVHVNGTAWRYIRASMSLANFLPPHEEKYNFIFMFGYTLITYSLTSMTIGLTLQD